MASQWSPWADFSGVSVATASGMRPSSNAADAAPLEVRQNKKSKWDKVIISACCSYMQPYDCADAEELPFWLFCLLSGGWWWKEFTNWWTGFLAAAAAAQAVLLSAANVGSGYTGFV